MRRSNPLQTWWARTVLLFAACACVVVSVHAQPKWKNIVDIHGPSFVDVYGGAIGPNGMMYVAGTFEGSVTIDDDTLSSYGNYDNFTAQLSPTGALVDFDKYGGLDADDSRSIAVDQKGNVYACGSFLDQAIVQSQRVEAADGIGGDIYVAKFSKAGIIQWAKVIGSSEYDETAPYIAVDTLGNIYVAGSFGATMKVGATTLTSRGNADMFVLKMDGLGNVLWGRSAGSIEFDQAKGLMVEPDGSRVTVVGTFEGLVSFGTAELRSLAKNTDFAVWNLSGENGATQWVRHIGSTHTETHINVTSDHLGGSFVVGAVQGVVTCHDRTLKSNGEFASDIMVTHFNRDGELTFAKLYGSTNEDVALAAGAGNGGLGAGNGGLGAGNGGRAGLLVTGYFDEETTIEGTALKSNGGHDIFVMRVLLNPTFTDGVVDWVRSAGGKFDDEGRVVLHRREDEIPFVMGVYDTEADFGGIRVGNGRFSNGFVAEMECGPNTALTPVDSTITICEGSDYDVSARAGYPGYRWHLNGEQTADTTHGYNLSSLSKGTYTVYASITDFFGCILNSDTVTVIITDPLPEPVITRDGDQLTCNIESVRYQWYREGTIINGATTKSITISGDGLYRVRIEDDRMCNRTSANFLIGTTSVNEETGVSVSAYPNPFGDDITVQAPIGTLIDVADVMGQRVARIIADGQPLSVSIPGSTGVYILTAHAPQGVQTLLLQKR